MISLNRTEIEACLDFEGVASAIAAAYLAASRGEVTLPAVGHITFPELGADCHIKYGHLHQAPTFVIKVATGFPTNAALSLPTGNGLVLVLSALTGEVEAVLHDEMRLTDVRTGIGGAIASRALARKDAQRLLVVGTGPQAICQLEAHKALLPNLREFTVWGREAARAEGVAEQIEGVNAAPDLRAAIAAADIIVTATGAQSALFPSDWVRDGTHITAVGADAPGKQELDVALVARASVRVVDLIAQCVDHGEVSHAVAASAVEASTLVEIGALLNDPTLGRSQADQVTLADLTGIAAQDIAIANAVLTSWKNRALS